MVKCSKYLFELLTLFCQGIFNKKFLIKIAALAFSCIYCRGFTLQGDVSSEGFKVSDIFLWASTFFVRHEGEQKKDFFILSSHLV